MMADMNVPHVPMSWGEVIDKITILEVKTVRLSTEAARANAAKELKLLRDIAAPVMANAEVSDLASRLKVLNESLWEIEECIRAHERAANFDDKFIGLARAVYHQNDERGAIKRELNLMLGSDLVEEKSY